MYRVCLIMSVPRASIYRIGPLALASGCFTLCLAKKKKGVTKSFYGGIHRSDLVVSFGKGCACIQMQVGVSDCTECY